MNKVYLVLEANYEGWIILGIFTNKENAEKRKKDYLKPYQPTDDDVCIKEVELDDFNYYFE